MNEKQISFTLRTYGNDGELSAADRQLLEAATAALPHAYAPYSKYHVAAAALLENGEILTGTNQENASFPAGICAEGTVVSAAAAMYPGVAIRKIVITVKSEWHVVNHPVSPCGVCRQRMLEYETRFQKPIEIIMKGETGDIYSVSSVRDLLPLAFTAKDL